MQWAGHRLPRVPPLGYTGQTMKIEFRCLGNLEIVRGQRVMPAGGPLQRGLLAILLLNANHAVSTDRIVDGLWDDPPDTALGQVQTRIWRLRQLLHSPATDASRSRSYPQLVTQSGGYALMVDPAAVDLQVFDQRVRDAAAMLARGRAREAAGELRSALALFRGPSFANVTAPAVVAEAKAVEERRMAALEQRIETELSLGMHAQLIPELRELVAVYPYQERLRLHLMRALHRSGRRAEAVAAYREAHRAMVDGVGLEPSRELKECHQEILLSDVTANAPGPPSGAPATTSRDAGTSTGGRSWAREPRDLPADTGLLVGRCQEIDQLAEWLRAAHSPMSRIAAISGMPGVGKTALAVRVAHLLTRDTTDGQLYARLGSDTEPGAVLHRFLRTLGIPEGEVPNTLDERSALFRACMADRRAVVVLDDVWSEAQVRPLLSSGPASMTLVTSRRPLTALDSAHLLELDPLGEADGVRLLREIIGPGRADAEPGLAERIVARCEGLPLAVRAAAARLRVRPHWSLAQYLALLENPGQQLDALCLGDLDVRSAIESSYLRLPAPARRLFCRLGCLEEAEFTAARVGQLVDVPTYLAAELVEALVEARLVWCVGSGQAGTVHSGVLRYRMGELCRLVARERAVRDCDEV